MPLLVLLLILVLRLLYSHDVHIVSSATTPLSRFAVTSDVPTKEPSVYILNTFSIMFSLLPAHPGCSLVLCPQHPSRSGFLDRSESLIRELTIPTCSLLALLPIIRILPLPLLLNPADPTNPEKSSPRSQLSLYVHPSQLFPSLPPQRSSAPSPTTPPPWISCQVRGARKKLPRR